MLFDSRWPGDAIAAPVWVTNDRENETPPCVDDGSWSPTDIRPHQSREELDRRDVTKSTYRRGWVIMLTSILGGLRSTMRCRRELRRTSPAWEKVDDRTLKDIGISRLDVEYARDAPHWG